MWRAGGRRCPGRKCTSATALYPLVFIIFDVEVVFLWPWVRVVGGRLVQAHGLSLFAFLDMLVFVTILVVGLKCAHGGKGSAVGVDRQSPGGWQRKPQPLARGRVVDATALLVLPAGEAASLDPAKAPVGVLERWPDGGVTTTDAESLRRYLERALDAGKSRSTGAGSRRCGISSSGWHAAPLR